MISDFTSWAPPNTGLSEFHPAATYITSEMRPLVSSPTARASGESEPCLATSSRDRMKYAPPASSSTTPYAATAVESRCASPTHAVVKGISESQNSRWRFAHRMRPSTWRTACSR